MKGAHIGLDRISQFGTEMVRARRAGKSRIGDRGRCPRLRFASGCKDFQRGPTRLNRRVKARTLKNRTSGLSLLAYVELKKALALGGLCVLGVSMLPKRT